VLLYSTVDRRDADGRRKRFSEISSSSSLRTPESETIIVECLTTNDLKPVKTRRNDKAHKIVSILFTDLNGVKIKHIINNHAVRCDKMHNMHALGFGGSVRTATTRTYSVLRTPVTGIRFLELNNNNGISSSETIDVAAVGFRRLKPFYNGVSGARLTIRSLIPWRRRYCATEH